MDNDWKTALVIMIIFLNIFSLGMFYLFAWALL
jgi:hypothetical protein